MKRRVSAIIILLMLMSLLVQPAIVTAADLQFEVPREQVSFFINKDGTATIEYTYDFVNRPGAPVIDYVDIGVPNNNYDIRSVTGDVDGKALSDFQPSDYVKPGIAVGLGRYAIQAGSSARLHVRIGTVRNIVFESDLTNEKEAYASIGFSPNYFGSQYVRGTTDLTVNILFPPELGQEEPRYHAPQKWPGPAAPFTGADQATGLKFYSWQFKTANAYTQYIFGASFPARLVPAASIQKKPLVTLPPSEDLICYGIAGFFALIFGFSIFGAIWGQRSRKLQYLPPKIAIEGMGIKRGLTAVEAAVLMEQPMDKILTMILFGVIKKNAASVVTKEPLKLQIADPQPAGLNGYEQEFLFAFQEDKQPERRRLMQTMMINLVKSITEKMKGFSRKETIAYYESIMKQAWQQVETAATPDVKMQAFDDNLDWTLLDRRFNDRTRDVFRTGPVYVPVWWHRYDPTFSTGGSSPSVGGGGGGQPITISRPNVPGSDFAASVVNGIQGFAAGAVGDLTSFTGGVTAKTNPVPVTNYNASGRSGGSGGGHSCACACACACAGCACACAGGGR
jgi:hypothetical protein